MSFVSYKPCFFCHFVPAPRSLPPLLAVAPPVMPCFSTMTTSAPASFASMAAARPPAPAPHTTTSTVRTSSEYSGAFGAGAALSAAMSSLDAPAALSAAAVASRMAAHVRSAPSTVGMFSDWYSTISLGKRSIGVVFRPQAMPRYSLCCVTFTDSIRFSDTVTLTMSLPP